MFPELASQWSGGDGEHRGGPAPPQWPAGRQKGLGSGDQPPQTADRGRGPTRCQNQGEMEILCRWACTLMTRIHTTENKWDIQCTSDVEMLTNEPILCGVLPCSVGRWSSLSWRPMGRWKRLWPNKWRTWRQRWTSGESDKATLKCVEHSSYSSTHH